MCGIIGYVGNKAATPILLEGLRRLEYRGYDSAGVAVVHDGNLLVRKKKGRIDEGLARLLKSEPAAGTLGIAHTRWATHGPPSDINSHPHSIHPAKSPSSTTASLKIMTRSGKSCSRPDTNSAPPPTPRCWRI